ncbi:diguanylate cyclase [Marinomonas ushuaiensis DSM 15871]|uniref:diguanylate cyclase n=1 Tax=Marinomonas ushuaiensis DSM 15871 TaxID=1122207 RepID=X7E8G0_9GAMM|nr:GGDEF domain-containing protein [Marinomonas ushuaiensis]ETX11461.1 diguanylate cyclase [Marinomonas ushuaiensis DSM 15871]
MFQHSVTQANELMRLAIPLMEKLDIPPTPYNYGIWYEYTSNRTPKLNRVVDRTLRRFGSLPAFVSQELFNEFLLPKEFQYAYQQGPVLKELTDNLESETSTASNEIHTFHEALRNTKEALKDIKTPDQLEKLTSQLELRTLKTNQIIEHYSQSLLRAQEEIAKLREGLSDANKASEIDPLTLLANEKGFEHALLSLTPYAEDDLSLILIDIDDLSVINNEYGKNVGTSLIRYIAKLLFRLLPEKASIGRINGGRFAILLSETEIAVAVKFAELLRNEIETQKIRYKNTKVLLPQVTVSIGVTTLIGDESPNQLIKKAQHFLLYAKRSGKNQCCSS